MTHDRYQTEIEEILRHQLRVIVSDPDADLLDSGLLDSLGLVDLVAAIEQRFGIVVNLIELDLDDVRTVRSISVLVAKKLT